jgi:polysaccharide biosynthesis protein PslG
MTARLQRFLVSLALGATLVLAAAPGARAAEKGLQTDLTWGTTADEQQRTVQALDGTGVQWIRLDISWANTERSPGAYDADSLAMTDHALELVEGTGAKVIMAVSETPRWASGSSNPNTPPHDSGEYASFIQDMAARYAGRVAGWEVWNEPNHPRFWNPTPDPAGYARLLKAAYPAVKAGDPGATVVFGGIAHNDYEYLEDVYAADPDIGDSFDVMATHPYTAGGQSPAVVDRTETGRMTSTSFLAFEEVHDVMLAHGDDRPIWLTEFGWSTNSDVSHPLGGVTEDVQASHLGLAFELLEESAYVEVAVVYNFRNNFWAGDADNWEDQLGLLRTDFSPKPAYNVFKQYSPPSGRQQPPPAEPPVVLPGPAQAPPPVLQVVPPAAPPAANPSGPRRSGSITLSVRRLDSPIASLARTGAGAGRTSFRLNGRLSAATDGRVRIVVQRRDGGSWKRVRSIRVAVRDARFTTTISIRRGARRRVKAVHYADGARASASPVHLRG